MAALAREGEEVVALGQRLAQGEVPALEELAAVKLLAPLLGAPHDPVHHAEGDPLTHTHMVLDELVRLDGFADLLESRRVALALATILHDVAKPQTAVVDAGRVSHPSHAPKGAKRARAALYAAAFDPALREAVATLCRRHMQPHFALRRAKSDTALLRWVAGVSLEVPVRLLLMLAIADSRGRKSPREDDSGALLMAFAAEHDLLDAPWTFADATARRDCCRDADRDPRFPSGVPDGDVLVTIVSGLPGSGKSTLARSLDAERISVEDLMNEGKERGAALQACRERLRQALRERRDAVWDATMLTRQMRRPLVSLVEDYGARCVVHCCELPDAERRARNAARKDPVPDDVVADMLYGWELPTFDEALQVTGRPPRL